MTFPEGYVAPQKCPCDELKRVRDKTDSLEKQSLTNENGMALLQMGMKNLEENVQKDIESLRSEMKKDMDSFRSEVKKDISVIRSDISELKDLLTGHINEENGATKKKLSDYVTALRDFLIAIVLLYIAVKMGVK